MVDEIKRILKANSIIFSEISNIFNSIRLKWVNSFCNNLTRESKESFVNHINNNEMTFRVENIAPNGMLWESIINTHSNEVKEQQHAIEELDKTNSKTCYIFFHYYTTVLKIHNADKVKSELLSQLNEMHVDMYIVDENFEWSYIKTHEDMDSRFGPYFIRRN